LLDEGFVFRRFAPESLVGEIIGDGVAFREMALPVGRGESRDFAEGEFGEELVGFVGDAEDEIRRLRNDLDVGAGILGRDQRFVSRKFSGYV